MDTIRAARRTADTGAPLLNLLMPGLGQLYQHRYMPAAHFLVDATALSWLFVMVPSLRLASGVALVAIAAWSVVDAELAGRRASSRLGVAG